MLFQSKGTFCLCGSHREARGGGVMVWGCFAADTVGELFKIHGTLIQHGHSAATRRRIWFAISGTILSHPLLNRKTNPKHTSRLRRGCWTKKGQWRGAASDYLASTITWLKPSWDGLGWVGLWSEEKAANERSAPLGTLSRRLENHSRWRPHEADWENAKSVQSRHQSERSLLWKNRKYTTHCGLFNTDSGFVLSYIWHRQCGKWQKSRSGSWLSQMYSFNCTHNREDRQVQIIC